jgi:hypothetical protein
MAGPEEVFQAIERHRSEARDEIDRLIRFLVRTENHMAIDCELEDGIPPNTMARLSSRLAALAGKTIKPYGQSLIAATLRRIAPNPASVTMAA